jgi:hypothetical protein
VHRKEPMHQQCSTMHPGIVRFQSCHLRHRHMHVRGTQHIYLQVRELAFKRLHVRNLGYSHCGIFGWLPLRYRLIAFVAFFGSPPATNPCTGGRTCIWGSDNKYQYALSDLCTPHRGANPHYDWLNESVETCLGLKSASLTWALPTCMVMRLVCIVAS